MRSRRTRARAGRSPASPAAGAWPALLPLLAPSFSVSCSQEGSPEKKQKWGSRCPQLLQQQSVWLAVPQNVCADRHAGGARDGCGVLLGAQRRGVSWRRLGWKWGWGGPEWGPTGAVWEIWVLSTRIDLHEVHRGGLRSCHRIETHWCLLGHLEPSVPSPHYPPAAIELTPLVPPACSTHGLAHEPWVRPWLHFRGALSLRGLPFPVTSLSWWC